MARQRVGRFGTAEGSWHAIYRADGAALYLLLPITAFGCGCRPAKVDGGVGDYGVGIKASFRKVLGWEGGSGA
jgi:hypothetical protein